MTVHQNIERFLSEEFGLSQNEVTLFLGLLKHGPSTVIEASIYTNMNRATVHMNVEYLTKKGLVTQTKKGRGSKRLIVAEPPERLGMVLEQKKVKILNAEKQLPNLIKEIYKEIPTALENTDVDIRYYKGINELSFLYDEVQNAKEIRAYVNCQELANVFPNNVDNFISKHKERSDMEVWEIMEDSITSRDYASKMPNERYFCRLAPPDMNLSVIDYMIFDGKVGIVELKGDPTGMIIYNESYYQNAKAIFEFVWQFLKPHKG